MATHTGAPFPLEAITKLILGFPGVLLGVWVCGLWGSVLSGLVVSFH